MLDSGEVPTRFALAKMVGVSHVRVSQLLSLLFLAPEIQDRLLLWDGRSRRDPIFESDLRRIAPEPDWNKQRRMWHELSARLDCGRKEAPGHDSLVKAEE